jgi:hypothetical protein
MKTQKITKTHTHTPLKAMDFSFRTQRKDKPIMPVFRVEKIKDYTILPINPYRFYPPLLSIPNLYPTPNKVFIYAGFLLISLFLLGLN